MTTATKKPTTMTQELNVLEAKRREAHAALHEVKNIRLEYARETDELEADYTRFKNAHPEDSANPAADAEAAIRWRENCGIGPSPVGNPRPGTPTARKLEKLKARISGGNPHDADHGEAIAGFHRADAAVQNFRIANTSKLIEEAATDSSERMRAALTEIVAAADEHAANIEAAREIVLACPGLDAQALGYDRAPLDWAKYAREALEHEVFQPRLTDLAAARMADFSPVE